MESKPVKAFIVEEDQGIAKKIAEVLPEYITKEVVNYEKAKRTIEPRPDMTTVVIMRSDEHYDKTLSLFSTLCSECEKRRSYIPVVLITSDELSDASFSFYDYGDPFFYEGEINDSDFYSKICEAIESADDFESTKPYEDKKEQVEDEIELIEPETSPDKLMGMAFEVHVDENEPPRTAAYDNKEVIEMIMSLTGHNKERAAKLWQVLEAIAKERSDAGEPVDYVPRTVGEKRVSQVTHNDKKPKEKMFAGVDISNLHKLNDVGKVQKLLDEMDIQVGAEQLEKLVTKTKSISHESKTSTSSNILKHNAVNTMQGRPTVANTVRRKMKILIVDIDPMTFKACELFLEDKAELHFADTNMKAIDFYVKDYADIVIIENDMPYLSGPKILSSIRLQPYGRYVKGIILVDSAMPQFLKEKIKNMPGVCGIVEKPILKKNLVKTISSCMFN